MRQFRRLTWAGPLMLCALGSAMATGCESSAQVQVATPEPPPPPPPQDQDGDGILDPDDKCPTEKEDGNPPDPNDGCPNKDLDNDGIPIPQDQCPNEPETVNGYQDDDGCPDKKPIVELKEKEVKINQKILFAKNSAEIQPESMEVVDAVAELLKNNPEVQLIEVGGHASKEGSEWYNRDLTQKRVDSVVKALVEKGVEKDRLMSQGYGFYCLIAEGETEAAHEQNRRVEFKILHRKGKVVDQTRGCEEAEKKGIKPKPLSDPKPFGEGEQEKPAAPAAGAAAPQQGAEPGAAPAQPAQPPAGGQPKPAAPKPAPQTSPPTLKK